MSIMKDLIIDTMERITKLVVDNYRDIEDISEVRIKDYEGNVENWIYDYEVDFAIWDNIWDDGLLNESGFESYDELEEYLLDVYASIKDDIIKEIKKKERLRWAGIKSI